MRLPTAVALVTGLTILAAASARAEEAQARRPLGIGETLPTFEAKDVDGRAFDLAKARAVTPEQALAAVAGVAKARGAADVTRETRLDAIPGLAKGAARDPEATQAFLGDVGRPFGLVADAAKATAWATLGDVAAWVEGAGKAPLLLVAWSSTCPTCKLYEERLVTMATATGARVYLLASNWNDEDAQIRTAVAERKIPFPVLLDRDQRVTDVLGGRKTPHVFAFDATNVLRYAGGIDSDPALQEEESKRATWLADALRALADGRSFDVLLTTPKG